MLDGVTQQDNTTILHPANTDNQEPNDIIHLSPHTLETANQAPRGSNPDNVSGSILFDLNNKEDVPWGVSRYDSDSDDEESSSLYPACLLYDSDSCNEEIINPHRPAMNDHTQHSEENPPHILINHPNILTDSNSTVEPPWLPESNTQQQRRRTLNRRLVPSQVIQRDTNLQEFAAPQISGAHQRENEQANHYIGDTLALPMPPNTTRLYFQNVNGISLAMPGTWETTCMDLRDMQVDLGLLVEHKLDTTQPRVMKHLHDNIKLILDPGTFSINATSSQVQAQSMFKPGRVLSITHGCLKGRILDSGKDTHGQWVYSKFRRNTGPLITVIATYQVVDTSPQTSGPTTYATQLYTA